MIATAILLALGSAGLAWWRLPVVARDTLWAEDGRTFLAPAASATPWSTLVTPYAGYLHTVPRLEALLIAHVVPVAEWATAMTAINCLVAGIVAGIVFVTSGAVVPWLPGRVLLASLTVLTPLASREVLGDAADLHSILFWGVFWILLSAPASRAWSAVLAGATLLSALTEIQTLFLLPMIAIRLRDRRTWPVKIALVVGTVTQLIVAVTVPRPSSTASPDSPWSIAFGWVINAILSTWAPRSAISGLVAALGPVVAVIAVIPAVSLIVVLARGRRDQRLAALLLLAGSAVVWVVSVSLNPAPYYDYADPSVAASGQIWLARYGVVPAMMLLAITVLAITVVAERRPRGHPAALLAIALTAVLLLQAPTTDTRRSDGPEWSPQIPAATERCEAAATVRLRETLGWTVTVPCSDLPG